MRRSGTPIEITDGGVSRLARISLTQKDFDEAWMQGLIHENPDLLPLDELRPTLGELTSLGREIATPVGPIDNLFVDSNGTLVIVEAKLYRNPEARREVVGQIIDYAAALSRWGFSDIDAAVRGSNAGQGIIDLLNETEASEARIIDGLERSLRTGDFLLLVVGDGIRESVESIAELLAGAPHLGFTFALIELAVYESRTGAKTVVPSLVAHSVEITRATVRVESQSDGRVEVRVAALSDESGQSGTTRKKLDADSFERLFRESVDPAVADEVMRWRDLVAVDPRMRVDYATTSMIFRIKPTDVARAFTGVVIYQNGTAGIGWLEGQVKSAGVPVDIATRFAVETARLVGAVPPSRYPDSWGDGTGATDRVDVADVLEHREAFTSRMRQVADEIESALGS
jgi:hypothetical protein